MKLVDYPNYSWEQNQLYKDSKLIEPYVGKTNSFFKLKNKNGNWDKVSVERVKFLAGDLLQLPPGSKRIPDSSGYFIDPSGGVYTFNKVTPSGKKLKPWIGAAGYWMVRVHRKTTEIHILMAKTFININYIEEGLCCMHKDDDKLNCLLSNLKVGTYSENNKSAYANGLNTGNLKGINKK